MLSLLLKLLAGSFTGGECNPDDERRDTPCAFGIARERAMSGGSEELSVIEMVRSPAERVVVTGVESVHGPLLSFWTSAASPISAASGRSLVG